MLDSGHRKRVRDVQLSRLEIEKLKVQLARASPHAVRPLLRGAVPARGHHREPLLQLVEGEFLEAGKKGQAGATARAATYLARLIDIYTGASVLVSHPKS
jgi:hypothetical protein